MTSQTPNRPSHDKRQSLVQSLGPESTRQPTGILPTPRQRANAHRPMANTNTPSTNQPPSIGQLMTRLAGLAADEHARQLEQR